MKKNTLLLISLTALVTLLQRVALNTDAAELLLPEAFLSNEVIAEGRLEPVHATNLTFQARGVVELVILVKGGRYCQRGRCS
jgi:hypothetical protein